MEILEDLNEQSELSVAKNYQIETVSKSLNKLNQTMMITDELLDSILEEELNGIKDKENDLELENLNEENKTRLNNLVVKKEQTDADKRSENEDDSITRTDCKFSFEI